MTEKKLQIQELKLEEAKTLGALIDELHLNNKYQVILVDGKKVVDLNTIISPDSKIIILPKIVGG
ncbi:MAG: MoaD/ThiS family protein [Candidatus Helarchaeales archaeon]